MSDKRGDTYRNRALALVRQLRLMRQSWELTPEEEAQMAADVADWEAGADNPYRPVYMMVGDVARLQSAVTTARSQVDVAQAAADRYRAVLDGLRRRHTLVDDDCWYSCPKATYADGTSGYCGLEERDICECGADEYNAIIDAALHPELTDA